MRRIRGDYVLLTRTEYDRLCRGKAVTEPVPVAAKMDLEVEEDKVLARLHAQGLIGTVTEVGFAHSVSPNEIVSRRRTRRLTRARFELWWRIRTERNLSYPELGELVGRDHTTVMYGVDQHEASRQQAAGKAAE